MRAALGSSISSSLSSSLSALAQASPLNLTRDAPSDELLATERRMNPLLLAFREDPTLRGIFLDAASREHAPDVGLCLLLPQSSTLNDVEVTAELIETHLVFLQHAQRRDAQRRFTSLNGLHGTCQTDGSIVVHGRLRRAVDSDSALVGSIDGWATGGGDAAVPQLESQIVVLRVSHLPASAWLPLRAPVELLVVSDPLFYPGCGWKLPLALRCVCTHRFRDREPEGLLVDELPQLLFEYQVMARAWAEGTPLLPPAERGDIVRPPVAPLSPALAPAHPAERLLRGVAGGGALFREHAGPAVSRTPSASAAALLRGLLGSTDLPPPAPASPAKARHAAHGANDDEVGAEPPASNAPHVAASTMAATHDAVPLLAQNGQLRGGETTPPARLTATAATPSLLD
jgi:hypothetical protein